MKLITYSQQDGLCIGAVDGNRVFDLSMVAPDMLALIEMGAEGLSRAKAAMATAVSIPLANVHLHAPIPNPRRNVMCLGLNYAEHAAESYGARGQATVIPTAPIVFTKATTAVSGPTDPIPYDPLVSTEIDWEAELGVIIGMA
ncbi:MAG: fumarylacetoacetate hydrolase family protein, partial [Anaerolineales bacterium]|nr:fumarylacetoacetate hydrolase family protein [Anaerolineales bacterium]